MLKIRALRTRLYEHRFELLMLSLWCVFVLNILFPDNIYRGYAQAIYLPIQLLAAMLPAALVQHAQAQYARIQRDAVAKEQQKDKRQNPGHQIGRRIAHNLLKFFAHQGKQLS